ncbi:uncharacterized protein AFUA_2G03570 [Aspergillus fumigatus Af293]
MPLSKEARMQMAITAWKQQKVKSKLKAAQIFGVPESSLRKRLSGVKPRTETRANSHKLTATEEETLVKRLLDADKRGFSIRPEFLRGMAQILLCERTQDSTAVLGRAKQEDPKVIRQWFETVRKAIQEHGIHEDDIWNFDETGFAMGLCITSKVITAVERSERPRTVIQGNREWVTIIECISSKGTSIPPVVILKGKEHQAACKNGWITDEIDLHWLKVVFEPYSRRFLTGAKRLLILDGHSSHLTPEFDTFCKENAIICLCMPPHTSHLLQPLDVGVFGPLKRSYGKLVEGMMVAGNNHINKEDFLHLYPPAQDKVFNQANICNGFTGAGLKPLNEEQVLGKITFQLRTPTPLLAEGSISSAFQTPQNPRQLDHKVRTIQRSIQKRKLSSSPMAHIQHLEKAAQMAMNMNLLLQEEIKVLRAENERKVKKRDDLRQKFALRSYSPLGRGLR